MRKVDLTEEEWERLAAVSPEERVKALRILERWVHHEIIHRGFDLNSGPFSFAAMGGDAVSVIGTECLEALFCGEWHWKPTRELSSMLIQIAKSKMGHIIEDYYNRGMPEMILTSEQNFREELEMAVAAQWQDEAERREIGYETARKVAQGHPKLLKYLEAMETVDDYNGIARKMKINVKEVMKLEKQLLDLLTDK